MIAKQHTEAYIAKVTEGPIESSKDKNVSDTTKLANHCIAVAILIACPRIDNGKISEMINQNNEPTLMQ